MANFIDQDSGTPGIQDKTYNATDFKQAIDLSAWDMATSCGSCHVGGGFIETDRNGTRLTTKQHQGANPYDAYLFYVNENFDPGTGVQKHTVEQAPWMYPQYMNNDPTQGFVTVPYGWVDADGTLPNGMPVVAGQLMMPNVREMDCLMCHFSGYNNMMSSVMMYGGNLNYAGLAGSGILDINQMSPTYMGYNPALTEVYVDPTFGNLTSVRLNATALARINKQPASENCRMCHAPTSLKDFPDMMRDFLSSAPTVFVGPGPKTSNSGLVMPSWDFNAPFGNTWDFKLPPGPGAGTPSNPFGFAYWTSYEVNMSNIYSNMIAAIGFPAASGKTVYNTGLIPTSPMGAPGSNLDWASGTVVGGGNPSGTGPLYYESYTTITGRGLVMDQNAVKKGSVPFPRADWFKRGDNWGSASDDVHISLGCSGCHMDTNPAKVDSASWDGKSQCDPGRGFDGASGIESNSTVNGVTYDSRNTVKKCADCHVYASNYKNMPVNNFNAPNPYQAHEQAGLTANIVNAIGAKFRNATSTTVVTAEFRGNHIDVVDCGVCHVGSKKSIAVRLLDSTSGNRYPNMVGVDNSKGMLGMFTDPTPSMHNEYQNWTPANIWQRFGDGDLKVDGQPNPRYRRKVFQANYITASLWNNYSSIDANGDGFKGQREVGGLTMFDPWLQRDMKAGINFGPTGFAPVPVGFGNTTYQSAYDANGMFTGAFKYVGLYGGNVLFTTPQEIAAYKAYRTTNAAVLDPSARSWDTTELLLLGGPYRVTHGVKLPAQSVGAKKADGSFGCSDCHAASSSGFFDGTMDMVGSAIRSDTAGGNFMLSPAEKMEIKAYPEDLRTGAEVFVKSTGALKEIEFDEPINESGTDYKRVIDASRAEMLYPLGPWKDINGTSYATLGAWIGYLTNPATYNPGNYGMGAMPNAVISGTTPADADPSTTSLLELTKQSYTFNPNTTGNSSYVTYKWAFSDGVILTSSNSNGTITRDFTSVPNGNYNVTLTVTGVDGKSASTTTSIKVADSYTTGITINSTTAQKAVSKQFDIGNLTMLHDTVKIVWGDFKVDTISDPGSSLTVSKVHTYLSTGTKKMNVLVYQNGVQVGQKYFYITVSP